MKNSEIIALTEPELRQKIASERENLKKLRFAHAVTPIENPMKIRETRKLIARLQTALQSKTTEN